MANEALLTKRVAFYIRREFPMTPFRVDIGADIPLPPRHRTRLRELHGERWTRGYPDMLLASCRGGYGGLYIELKDTATVPKSEHTDTQKKYHKALRKEGYKVKFACGYGEAVDIINSYMSLKRKKPKKCKVKVS